MKRRTSYYGVGDGWCFCCGGFSDHVKLMFVGGDALDPVPPVTPVAMGKSMRGVELRTSEDIDTRQIATWMAQVTSVPGVGGEEEAVGLAAGEEQDMDSKFELALQTFCVMAEVENGSLRLPLLAHIRSCESEIGTTFPPEFIEYLLWAGDARIGETSSVTVLDPSLPTHLPVVIRDARARGLDPTQLPVAITGPNLVCLLVDGSVSTWPDRGAGWFFDLAHWLDDAAYS